MENSQISVYVAGGWKFRHDVKEVMNRLKAEGFLVVSGWIERENGINTPEALQSDAEADIREVLSSDVVLAVMEDESYAYRGTFTEIGCALGVGKPVVIFCPGTTTKIDEDTLEYSHYCQSNVFFHHGNCRQATTLEEGIKMLKACHELC
jgi:nucleoside 2-deoxyribosyltransferase